jgi:hypothetical protein
MQPCQPQHISTVCRIHVHIAPPPPPTHPHPPPPTPPRAPLLNPPSAPAHTTQHLTQVWDFDARPSGEPDDFIGRLIVPLEPFVGAGPVTVTALLHDLARDPADVELIDVVTSTWGGWARWLG